jgi:hypothetical protein
MPKKRFDHQVHEKAFSTSNSDCKTCHSFELNTETKVVTLPKDYDEFFTKPMKSVCHNCHLQSSKLDPKLFECRTCHANAKELLPDNHQAGWEKKHATQAYQKTECLQCHAQPFCTDCHRRFEPIQPKMHSRNYRFFHSVEARMNPTSCNSCHKSSTCRDCHLKEKILR